MIFKKSRKGKASNCKCDDNFTCGACMNLAADRNTADRMNSPESWYQLATTVKPSPYVLTTKSIKK